MLSIVVAHPTAGEAAAVAAALREAGHDVETAGSAALGLELIRARRADVLLVAAELGGLLDRVKRDTELFRTAVVVLAPHDLPREEAADLVRRGAQDLAFEPLRPIELVARAQAAGRIKILQEELATQTRRFEAQLFQDPLTGIFNRRYLFSQLNALISAARRHERPIAVAMIDFDGFKAINDEHGHEAGDRVLVAAAHALRRSLRAEDVLGRVGGDEFLALLPDTDATAAAAAAERLRTAVAAAEGARGATASVGWAVLLADETGDDLARRADDALYNAKRGGRNRVCGPATLPRRT